MEILGLDIGGSGIKGAPVDLTTGEFTRERVRIETPQPATPEKVVETCAEIVRQFGWKGPVGVGFPALVKKGVIYTATNIDKAWIGRNAAGLISAASGCPVTVGNDADVAALGEIYFGGGKGVDGVLVVVTLGTGIGTGLAINGTLVPNTELGHIFMQKGITAEEFAADRVRKGEKLDWNEWGRRVNLYLKELEKVLNPDLFIIGGGASKKFDKFSKRLDLQTPVVPAKLQNNAGIIGAALLAGQTQGKV